MIGAMRKGKNIVVQLGPVGFIVSWGSFKEFLNEFRLEERDDFYEVR